MKKWLFGWKPARLRLVEGGGRNPPLLTLIVVHDQYTRNEKVAVNFMDKY